MCLQVKTLKPLSTLKLQQLAGLMEEEAFADDHYIATEGEISDKFYIMAVGTVSGIDSAVIRKPAADVRWGTSIDRRQFFSS